MELLHTLEALEASLRCRGAALSQREALDRFEALLPQALAALRGARDRADADAAMRLLGALARFLWMRGHTRTIGLGEADATLALARSVVCEPHAARSGWLGAAQLDYAAAAYEKARDALARLPDDDPDVLNLLGMVEREQGRHDASAQLHRRAHALYQTHGDPWGEAHALSNLAVCRFRAGETTEAASLHEQALHLRRQIDDTLGVASSLGNLALVHVAEGRPELARPLYRESLTLREALGDRWGVAGSCVALAAVEVSSQQHRHAAPLLARAFHEFAHVGDRLGFAEAAELSAAVLLADGAPADAARAFGAAEKTRQSLGAPVPTSHRAQHDRLATSLAGYEALVAQGREDADRNDAGPMVLALKRVLSQS